MNRYDTMGRIERYYNTERASNLTLSQSVIKFGDSFNRERKLDTFLFHRYFSSNGITKLAKIFEIGALMKQFFYKIHGSFILDCLDFSKKSTFLKADGLDTLFFVSLISAHSSSKKIGGESRICPMGFGMHGLEMSNFALTI